MEIKKKVWVIMDKKRGIIAKGVPRNRYLELVSNEKDKKRILTYNSQRLAEAGFLSSWFFTGTGVDEYFEQEYNCRNWEEKKDCMVAVEADFTIKI